MNSTCEEKAHGDVGKGVDACDNRCGHQYLRRRSLVDQNTNASYQYNLYKRHVSTLTIAERKKELRAFARRLSTPYHAWDLSRRYRLQEFHTSVHTANRRQGRWVKLDSTRRLGREAGNRSRGVFHAYLEDELAGHYP